MFRAALVAGLLAAGAVRCTAAAPDELAAQRALLQGLEIRPEQLKPVHVDTPLVVGGSGPAGTRQAAERFAAIVREQGRPGALVVGRLLEARFDPEGKAQPLPATLTDAGLAHAMAAARQLFRSPGHVRRAETRR